MHHFLRKLVARSPVSSDINLFTDLSLLGPFSRIVAGPAIVGQRDVLRNVDIAVGPAGGGDAVRRIPEPRATDREIASS